MGAPIVERRQAVEGVERLWISVGFAGRPWYWVIVQRIDGVLIDSGAAVARRVVARFLREQPLAAVLTTHLHEDHVGNHEILPRDVPVHAPAGTVELLERGPPRIPLYRRLTWGTHGSAPGARAIATDRIVTPKRAFRVVPTPGHSEDHVSFLDEASGTVFTGDAFLGKPKTARLEEDVHTEIESLRRLAALDPNMLLSGHAEPLSRPRAKLLDTAEYFETLARKCWTLHDAGRSVRAIRKEVLGREPLLTRISRGEFSCDNMVVNLLRRRV